jgi:hypothetical protein
VEKVENPIKKGEDSKEEGERRLKARSEEPKYERASDADAHHGKSSERVLARADARLPIQEGVVECVQEGQAGRAAEDERLQPTGTSHRRRASSEGRD